MKHVLISHNSIPTATIGSWKRMLTDLESLDKTIFDYIVCPLESPSMITKKHMHVNGYRKSRVLNKLFSNYRFKNYTNALKSIISIEKQLLITIVDNVGILLAVDAFLKKTDLRNQVQIVFLQRGFDYQLSINKKALFYQSIDLLVVLTKASYKKQLSGVHALPCRVVQLYNGVSSEMFFPIPKEQKKLLLEKYKLASNTYYFLWVSQDRKKKGLHIILNAWKTLVKKYNNIELLVIGTKAYDSIPNVRYLGKIPNDKLPEYYQLTDFYLFSTLCHEGFGLSLAEALKSGAYCLVSDIDPMPEILSEGKYGQLVGMPNSEESWVNAIEGALKKYQSNNNVNPYLKDIPSKLYDFNRWCKAIAAIYKKEKGIKL
ncbi:glycosyltransferase family 4 protein [Winogradskyella sp.]|uniref:glycosyltransferase family 4 protein n=1 Tax=Winogradskyella sp. TaxID=1883156 RepID=UPI002613D517|nr:glycosyltransferase family 4 protein [Winogradskyella sp.]